MIKMGILSHEATMDSSSCLSGSKNDDDNTLLLAHIIERYSHMRRTYFVKHLKGNSGNQVQKLVDCQATRSKVAHVVDQMPHCISSKSLQSFAYSLELCHTSNPALN